MPCRELPSRAPHVDGLRAAISVAPSHSFNFDDSALCHAQQDARS